MKILKTSSPTIVIVFTAIVYFLLIVTYSWQGADGKGYTRVINSDGKGYYLYLQNIFINKSIAQQSPDDRFLVAAGNNAINKYFVGTAVAMLPFFGSAYFIASSQNNVDDGLSAPFQKAISIAALFYFILGLIFTQKLLSKFRFKKSTTALVIILFAFGSNLLVYAVHSSSMSHIYSFCFISGFLYFIRCFADNGKIKYLLLASFTLGITILIRPINVLVVFLIPFLTGSFPNTKILILKLFTLKNFILSTFVLITVLCIQPVLWAIQSGDMFVWSYQNEGFYFSKPKFLEVLFSFRKGFFIYTPLALLSLFGLYFIFKKSRSAFISIFLFLFIFTYFTAAWWNWYYGPSFSQRPFVEFITVFAILLAFLLEKTLPNIKKIVIGFSLLFVCLNLIQSLQYHKNIISSWDMNFDKYKYVFLKTSDKYVNCLGGNNDIIPYHKSKKLIYQKKNDFETSYSDCVSSQIIKDHIKQNLVCDFSNIAFNASIQPKIDESYTSGNNLFAEISIDCLQSKAYSSNAVMVLDFSDNNWNNYYYYAFKINEIPSWKSKVWRSHKYSVHLPTLKSADDKIKIYIWNIKKQDFLIDNFEVKIFSLYTD